MVDWLAGKRVRGTSSERTPLGVTLGGTGVGGWVELARTTLGSAGDTISVGSLSDKRYYMILANCLDTGGTIGMNPRLNGDTGSNYSSRQSQNGGADNTQTSSAQGRWADTNASDNFGVLYLANYSTKEKLMLSHSVQQSTAGAGTAPIRFENVSKHAQTSNPVNAFAIQNFGTGDYASGSEVVVLGYDPADTHTNNFWEELASVEASGSSTNLSTGTFTAKKYLWVQVYLGAVAGNVGVTFNNDTGANYARRFSQKGGADSTNVSQNNFTSMMGIGNTWASFSNNFIINNASNEKLVIGHMNYAVGTTATNDPERMEFVGKWANTSNQITEIDFDSTSGNFPTSSIIKVWGAD